MKRALAYVLERVLFYTWPLLTYCAWFIDLVLAIGMLVLWLAWPFVRHAVRQSGPRDF